MLKGIIYRAHILQSAEFTQKEGLIAGLADVIWKVPVQGR